MTLGDISAKITSLTGQNTTSYANSDRLIDINIWQQKVGSMIRDSEDESDFDDLNYTDYPNLTTALVANQRDYPIPSTEKMIFVKRVSIAYDGVNYYRADPIDSGEMYEGIGPASATSQNTKTDSLFDKTNPRYDVAYNSVLIYPRASTTDVANGAKIFIEWAREMKEFTLAELTGGTVVPGFDTNYHPILAYGPSFDFLLSKKLFSEADRLKPVLDDWEARLRRDYGRKQRDRTLSMNPLLNNYK